MECCLKLILNNEGNVLGMDDANFEISGSASENG